MLPYMPIDMPPYAAMALAGAFAALVFLYFRSARYHITPVQCMKLFALCALTCFLGSKLLALIVIFFLKDASWQQIPTLFLQGGYVFYGGLFGHTDCEIDTIGSRMKPHKIRAGGHHADFLREILPYYAAYLKN